MPLVSVVLPSYNHERWLGAAITSVLAQTCPDFELIIVDDGSKDRSLDVARSFADQRIRIVAQANAGAHAAINRGVELATAPFTAILNSDDVYRPRRLERLLSAAQRGPGLLWFTDLAIIDDHDRLDFGDMWAGHADLRSRCDRWPLSRVLQRGNLAHTTSNFFAATATFRDLGGMRPLRYVHDWDFLLRAVCRGRVGRLPETLLDYRRHGSNTINERDHWRHLVENGYISGRFLLELAGDDPESFIAGTMGNPCFSQSVSYFFRRIVDRHGEDEALAWATDPKLIARFRNLAEAAGIWEPRALFPALALQHWLVHGLKSP